MEECTWCSSGKRDNFKLSLSLVVARLLLKSQEQHLYLSFVSLKHYPNSNSQNAHLNIITRTKLALEHRYSVASKDSVMSWEQFLMFTEIVGLIKSQLVHVSDVAEVFVSTSRPIYRLVDEKTHLKMIRDRLRRNGRREGSWNDRTRSDDASSSYVRKFGSRIVLTRERELNFDGFVEALLRFSVPIQARSSSSESRDEFQHFHRRQDILHKHADAMKHVPVMDRMRSVLVIVSSYLIKSGHRQRTRQSRLYDFPDVSLSEIGHRLMKLIE